MHRLSDSVKLLRWPVESAVDLRRSRVTGRRPAAFGQNRSVGNRGWIVDDLYRVTRLGP